MKLEMDSATAMQRYLGPAEIPNPDLSFHDGAIPIVGGWVKLAVILSGLGAFALAWWVSWRARPEAAPAATPV